MTGFIVSVFSFRNRVSFKEAFEGLELGEGKLSRPVLRGPGGRKAAWLLGSYPACWGHVGSRYRYCTRSRSPRTLPLVSSNPVSGQLPVCYPSIISSLGSTAQFSGF